MSNGNDFYPVRGGEVFPSAEPSKGTPETAQNMQGAGFRVFTLDLTNALDNFEVRVKGNQFWVVNATDLEVLANVKFNDVGGEGAPVAKGFAIKGIPFNRVYVSSPAQAGKTIQFLTTFIPGAPVEFVNPTNSANEVRLLNGTRFETRTLTVAALTNTVLAPADAQRLSIMIKNTGVNPINIGHDTFGLLGSGLLVASNESLVLDKASADEIRGESIVGTTLIIIEEWRV